MTLIPFRSLALLDALRPPLELEQRSGADALALSLEVGAAAELGIVQIEGLLAKRPRDLDAWDAKATLLRELGRVAEADEAAAMIALARPTAWREV